MAIKVLFRGQSGRGVLFTTRLYLVPRLRMSGAIPLIYLYAFMAWAGTILIFIPNSDRIPGQELWPWTLSSGKRHRVVGQVSEELAASFVRVESSRFLRNVSRLLSDCKASHPRREQASTLEKVCSTGTAKATSSREAQVFKDYW
jgi:hypothetical protein